MESIPKYLENGSASIKFLKNSPGNFYAVLKERVDRYFKENQLSKYANREMYLKSFLLALMYTVGIAGVYCNLLNATGLILAYAFLGFTKGIIGFNFTHDVMHGAYFSSQKWNRLFSYFFDLNGTSSYTWKISHNLLHHNYTNIAGYDEDIDKAILLRLNPTDPLYPFHRFQHFYAPFLYCLTTVNWVLYSDYVMVWKDRYKMSKKQLMAFFLFKILNLLLFLVIPLFYLSNPWWQVVLGFFGMQFAGGFTIAIIFQLAHIVEGVEYPEPNQSGEIHEEWAIHEMRTTSNFAIDSHLCAFIVGGLNFQVEHHLFPYICHTHYPQISPILQQTAKEFNLPYHCQPTFKEAIKSHFRVLKKLGRNTVVDKADSLYANKL